MLGAKGWWDLRVRMRSAAFRELPFVLKRELHEQRKLGKRTPKTLNPRSSFSKNQLFVGCVRPPPFAKVGSWVAVNKQTKSLFVREHMHLYTCLNILDSYKTIMCLSPVVGKHKSKVCGLLATTNNQQNGFILLRKQ